MIVATLRETAPSLYGYYSEAGGIRRFVFDTTERAAAEYAMLLLGYGLDNYSLSVWMNSKDAAVRGGVDE